MPGATLRHPERQAWVRFSFPCAIALLLLPAVPAFPQGGRASINGTITDPSGAVIAGAVISAKSLETGQISTVTAGSEGHYSIPFLPLGRYDVTASHPGFNSETQTGITLS